MIKSFKCKETERLFRRKLSKIPHDIQRTALRKLLILDAAASLKDLRSLPGDKLEALKGQRKGQHSIRINQQFRICFKWQGTDVYDVEILDYH